ncbi:MAG: hypothetical protein ABIJ83_02890 [Patescibacteria group bacterium]|nr:hypothetical protein [Patescibacteria group bacterium]MBU2081383.1 hypothetical protein [Patescibacteria group bacterium]MBU2250449.1 hypothetical protein [Patescibacteria group bacterium]
MKNKKILLGLTTITPGEWRNKIKEIDKLGLKEIALFLTCVDFKERQELYRLLEKTKLINIPHVHLRADMEINELKYLNNKFKTEIFNIHTKLDTVCYSINYGDFEKKIYVENTSEFGPIDEELEKYAGFCLDLSHWEAINLDNGEYSSENIKIKRIFEKYKTGVNHVSAIKSKKIFVYDNSLNKNIYRHDVHLFSDLKDLDYVKKYKDYLADIISIELENSLTEQLKVKKYLEKILDL